MLKPSSRHLEGVFSITFFVLQDVLKNSWRRLWKTSCKHDLRALLLSHLLDKASLLHVIFSPSFERYNLYLLRGIIIAICTEAYSEPCQISETELFMKILHLSYLTGFWIQLCYSFEILPANLTLTVAIQKMTDLGVWI